MQGKQRQDEDFVKFGLPGGRSDDVRAFLAGMRGTFALLGAGLRTRAFADIPGGSAG